MGSWVIGPGALIYKCVSSLNTNDECGYIKNGKLVFLMRDMMLRMRGPTGRAILFYVDFCSYICARDLLRINKGIPHLTTP